MNRAAVIEQLKQTQDMLAKLLARHSKPTKQTNSRLILPIPPTIPAHLRAIQQGQQGNRTRRSLKLPSHAELGIQRRLPRLGALAAHSRVRSNDQYKPFAAFA
jgi:hypothetical protein